MKAPALSRTVGAVIVLAGLWTTGCATMTFRSYQVGEDDLRGYRTYDWAPADTWSTGDPRLDNNRFFDERVRARVEQELGRRGFEKSGATPPDILVHYHANISQEVDSRTLDRNTPYCADADCRPRVYDKGTLFVDLMEPGTNRLLWRGWAEGSIDGVVENQKWMERRIDDAVEKILAGLPHL